MEKRNIEKVGSNGSTVKLDCTTKVTVPEDNDGTDIASMFTDAPESSKVLTPIEDKGELDSSSDEFYVADKYRTYKTTDEFIKAINNMRSRTHNYEDLMVLNTALSYVEAFTNFRDRFVFEKNGEPTTEDIYAKLDSILVHLPVPTVYEQLAEEYTECAKAALKIARIIRGENPTPITMREAKDNILEEVADVDLVWKVLSLVQSTPHESVQTHDARMYTKLDRWIDRLTGDDINKEE